MQKTVGGRFKIEPKSAPPAYKTPNKFDVSARKVRLAAMLLHEAFEYKLNKEVVLSRPCIYGVFSGHFGGFKPLKHKCVGCMRCDQEYPHIMTVKPSEAYQKLGDSFWTPEMVFTVWSEAATGEIPVKGMGHKGAFGGEGFDGIWTDMSEIVRPTRDGVYGREYISTGVDMGKKTACIDFSRIDAAPETVEIPVPIIFDEIPKEYETDEIRQSVGIAADQIGTLHVAKYTKLGEPGTSTILPFIDAEGIQDYAEHEPKILEFESENPRLLEALTSRFHSTILIPRLALNEESAKVACQLVRKGAHGIHLY